MTSSRPPRPRTARAGAALLATALSTASLVSGAGTATASPSPQPTPGPTAQATPASTAPQSAERGRSLPATGATALLPVAAVTAAGLAALVRRRRAAG